MSQFPRMSQQMYEMALSQLPPAEREVLRGIVDEMGGINKLMDMVEKDLKDKGIDASEINFDEVKILHIPNGDTIDQMDDAAFERLLKSGALFNMSEEEFEHLIGNEPTVTPMQEEAAWQATDELLAKFFKKA